MVAGNEFFIDDKPFPLERKEERVSTILNLVGKSSKDTLLVSAAGVEHGDPEEVILIAPGDRFTTKTRDSERKPHDKPIRYKVNGEECSTAENPISVETILRNAGPGAAINIKDLSSYLLENTVDGRRYENLSDLVTVNEGDNFLAIHAGSTPVAL